jgi:hypothetical protein
VAGTETNPYVTMRAVQEAEDAKKNAPNALVSGLKTGIEEAAGQGAGFLGAIGKASGWQGLSDAGDRGMAAASAAAATVNRPDLENLGDQSLGSALPYIGYQAAKMAPLIAGIGVTSAALPEIAATSGLARGFGALPAVLGGGGDEAGALLAKRAIAAQIVGDPLGAGGAYQSASEKPGGATAEDARQALGMAPAYGGLFAAELAPFGGEVTGSLLARMAKKGITSAATGMVQSGGQQALTDTLRPDLSTSDKMSNIVQATLAGGALGGALGAGFGIMGGKHVNPNDIPTADIKAHLDEQLRLSGPPGSSGDPQLALPAPNLKLDAPAMYTDANGNSAAGSPGLAELNAGPRQLDYSTIPNDKQGSLRWAKPYEQGTPDAPFAAAPRPELEAQSKLASDYLIKHAGTDEAQSETYAKVQERLQQVNDELSSRGHNPLIDTGAEGSPAGVVEPETDVTGGSAKSLAPTPAEPSTTLKDQLTQTKGLPKSLAEKIQGAADDDAVRAIIHDETIVQDKGGVGRTKAAKLAGILDDNGAPTALAKELDARAQEPAAAAAPVAAPEDPNAAAAAAAAAAAEPAAEPAPAPAGETTDPSITAALAAASPEEGPTIAEARAPDTTPEPAAPDSLKGGDFGPSDKKFQDDFKARVEGDTDNNGKGGLTGLGDLATDTPKNAEEAKQRIFHALGSDIPEASFSSVERLAREQGLIAKGTGKLTADGLRVARSQIPSEMSHTAAVERGHTTEAAIAAFEQGAKGVDLKGKDLTTPAAYADGKRWAVGEKDRLGRRTGPVPETNTGAETSKTLKRIGAGDELRPGEAEKARLAAEAALNDHIDSNYSSTHTPGELAQLKTLAREGRFSEVADAAKAMKDGETFLAHPVEKAPWVPAKADRILSAKAMTEQLRLLGEDRANKLAGASEKTKAENQRAQVDHDRAEVRYREELKSAINDARANGELSAPQRAVAFSALARGDYKSVERALSGQASPAGPVRAMLNGAAKIAAGAFGKRVVPLEVKPASRSVIDMALRGDVDGTLRAIKASTNNPGYKLIASKLEGLLDNVKLNVLSENDPRGADGRFGESQLEDHGGTNVNLFGRKGLNEETILHELIHAFVQQRWGGIDSYHEGNRELLNDALGRRGDESIAKFQDLWEKISTAMAKEQPDLLKNETWASEIHNHPDEMLSWVMTNDKAQQFLKGMDADGNKISARSSSLWAKVTDFFKSLLGLPNSKVVDSALDQIMAAGHGILDAGKNVEQGNDFQSKFAEGIHAQAADFQAGKFDHNKPFLSAIDKDHMTPADGNAAMKAAGERANKIEELVNKIPTGTMSEKLTKWALAWADPFHIVQHWGKPFDNVDPITGAHRNGPDEIVRAHDQGHTIQSLLAQHLVLGDDMVRKLMSGTKEEKAAAASTMQFMRNSVLGYRVDRSWADQAKDVREGANAAAVQKLHAADYRAYQAMEKAGTNAAYKGLRDTNDMMAYGHMAGELHNEFVKLVPDAAARSPAYRAAPGDNFQEALSNPANRLLQDPAKLKNFFQAELNRRLEAIDQHVEAVRGASAGLSVPEATKMTKGLVPLEQMAQEYRNNMAGMTSRSYFNLGRFGNHFVDIKIARDAQGNVKPEMVAALAKHLQSRGFDGITIMPENSSDHAFIRVENVETRDALARAAMELKGTGVLDETGGTDGKQSPLVVGTREQAALRNPGAENWTRDFIDKIQANPTLSPGEKTRLVGELQNMQLNLLSDKSLAQSLAKREGTHGWDSDMMRSWNNRGKIGASGIAGQTIAPKIAAALSNMHDAIEAANRQDPTTENLKTRTTMKHVENEFLTREAQARQPSNNPFLDRASAAVQASYLGGSISFVLTQLSQPLITTLPHLGSKYGFVKSADAMARNTKLAFEILKETMRLGMQTSKGHGADAPITAEALRNVKGLSDDQREFLLRMINTGQIDISGAARQQMRATQAEQGGKIANATDKTLRWGSAFGYYSETLTRLTAALATHQLDGAGVAMEDKVENARNTLKQTLFDYSPGSKGRMFGKQGVFGVATPLMTKFMTYTANVTGKLYREFHGAISADSTPEERMQSAKFLMGHLAMMTALAGTSGLPLTTALSAIYDKTHDALFGNGEPSDIRASFRNYLEGMFGHTAGSMISDGASRGIGVDLNQRLGEQDILPFSKFLADRRGFKEAAKDAAFRTFGAPTSLVKSWIDGMGRVTNGDVLGGMGEALPHVLAGPVKAYGMYKDGYVDNHGTKLPITASGADVLTQALGFNPSNKVDYNEAAHDVQVRGTLLTQQASSLKNQLANAITTGDTATRDELMRRATEFDQQHPTFAVLPQLNSGITNKVERPIVARAIGAPLGVKPQDIGAIQLSHFAAIGNNAQTR